MKHFLHRLGRAIRNAIEQEIPPELSYCEFDCRELDCPVKGWLECPKLLAHKEQMERLKQKTLARTKVLR